MDQLLFKKDELNKKYRIKATTDVEVRTPHVYRGTLTNITDPAVLESMIEDRCGYIERIPEVEEPLVNHDDNA